MMTVKGWVSGRVQGVFFRRYVQQVATAEGVNGYARNLPDGRVEVLLQGEAEAIDRVRAAVGEGPPRSRVDDVQWEVSDEPAEPGFRTL